MVSPYARAVEDFRVGYLEEAFACLRESNRILKRYPNAWREIPEFWANLLGAIANGNIASVPEDVVLGHKVREQQREEERQRILDVLNRDLGCPTTE